MGKLRKRYVYDEFTAAGDLSRYLTKLFFWCVYWIAIVLGSFAVAELFSIMGESTMADSLTRALVSVLEPAWTPLVSTAGGIMFLILALRTLLFYGARKRKWKIVFPAAWIVFSSSILLASISIIFFGFGIYGLWFPDTTLGANSLDAYAFVFSPLTNFPWGALPEFSVFEIIFLVLVLATSLGLVVYGVILFMTLLSTAKDVIFKTRVEESSILGRR